ncbi:MAG: 50S ribosomal protein L18 [Ignavibacteriae bacterium]|nr:50S ribosomal protein L18 [Ignavibacteriota bacterium]
MITKKKIEHRQRTKKHIRLHLAGSAERPRLTVFRSLKHVYAQLVDDDQGKTLVGVSDLTEELVEQAKAAKGQVAVGKLVGQLVARRAKEKNIAQVVFDRNGFRYHGVIKAVAEGAREGGLKF